MGPLARHRGFRRLWAGQAVTQLGTQVSILALPLTALVALDASAFEVTVVQAVQVAPYLLIGLPAGAWVDRMPRRPVLVAADLLRALALVTVPLCWALGVLTLWQLDAVGLALGAGAVFFDVAYQSFLPDLLPAEDLTEGNTQLELARSGSRVFGPALGGGLVSLLGGPVALVSDAASFLFSAAMVRRIPAGTTRPPRPEQAPQLPCREILQGLRFVRRHKLLAPITATSALLNLDYAMTSALVLTYASRDLGFSPARIGLVTALAGAGFVPGALVARRAGERLGTGPVLVWGAVLAGCGPLFLPAASFTAPGAMLVAGLFVQAFGVVVFNVNQVSLRQRLTPKPLLGRTNATVRFLVWGVLPLGALGAGALAAATTVRTAVTVAALAGIPAFLPVALSAVRSTGTRRRPDATDTPPREQALPSTESTRFAADPNPNR